MMINDPFAKTYPSFITDLKKIAKNASSPEDIVSWLNNQTFITSVVRQPYQIKTEPPQREYIVGFLMPDGSEIAKAIDISLGSPLTICDIHDV